MLILEVAAGLVVGLLIFGWIKKTVADAERERLERVRRQAWELFK